MPCTIRTVLHFHPKYWSNPSNQESIIKREGECPILTALVLIWHGAYLIKLNEIKSPPSASRWIGGAIYTDRCSGYRYSMHIWKIRGSAPHTCSTGLFISPLDNKRYETIHTLAWGHGISCLNWKELLYSKAPLPFHYNVTNMILKTLIHISV